MRGRSTGKHSRNLGSVIRTGSSWAVPPDTGRDIGKTRVIKERRGHFKKMRKGSKGQKRKPLMPVKGFRQGDPEEISRLGASCQDVWDKDGGRFFRVGSKSG